MKRREFLIKSAGLATLGPGAEWFNGKAFSIQNLKWPDGSASKNKRIRVHKQLISQSPSLGTGVILYQQYTGRDLRREEITAFIRSSDLNDTVRRRISNDNSRTWSEWELLRKDYPVQGEFTQTDGPNQYGTGPYDPVSGHLIKPVLQRIVKGDPKVAMQEIWKGNRLFTDHGFYQLSSDNGSSWGGPHQLKYEEGPDFNPGNWGDPVFFRTNEMYMGKAVVLKNGTVIITASVPVQFMDEEDKSMPSIFPNTYRDGCVAGARCFIGKWDPGLMDYRWTLSTPIFLPRRISTRGLDELDITELKNGSLLMIIRGSNSGLDPIKCPGRKWYSVSHNGGFTWESIKDLKFDTGESFFSPASISVTIRSSVTKKLYWIGNLSSSPVEGNSPRYPLVIAVINEKIPALKKNTLTIIDDRDPAEDSEFLQLSNFTVFEDRENKHFELYLTKLGQRGGTGLDLWTCDAYKYIIEFIR